MKIISMRVNALARGCWQQEHKLRWFGGGEGKDSHSECSPHPVLATVSTCLTAHKYEQPGTKKDHHGPRTQEHQMKSWEK